MKTKIAEAYITPASRVGGEWPIPIAFRQPVTKRFVRAYARACRRIGERVRIVWTKKGDK